MHAVQFTAYYVKACWGSCFASAEGEDRDRRPLGKGTPTYHRRTSIDQWRLRIIQIKTQETALRWVITAHGVN